MSWIQKVLYQYTNSEAFNAFNSVLDRVKIRINTEDGEIERDLNTDTYSNGLEFGRKSPHGWYSAFIRVDDAARTSDIDMKADILWGLYYSPHNSDDYVNHWGDVPVIVCDTFYCGAYQKSVLIDNIMVHHYDPGDHVSYFRWIHFNLKTGEVKAL